MSARDQAGHYAVLGVSPDATAEEVTAAYRRAAKRLHPDMPQTGDRAAFLRLQEAYQVLGDPIRRAGYDQAARASSRPAWRQEERALGFVAPLSWRAPPFLRVAMLAVTVLALGQLGWIFARGPSSSPPAGPPTAVPSAAAMAGQTATGSVTGPGNPLSVGTPAAPITAAPITAALARGDHFIAPGPNPAVLWERQDPSPGLRRAGHLAAFTLVTLTREADAAGYAEITTPAGQTALVEATRLLPGDARAARAALCVYAAGAPPRGGSLLVRPDGPSPVDSAAVSTLGAVRVALENREDRPAVFQLRDAAGRVAMAMYLSPRGQGAIENLPAGTYRAEFALGDLWSVTCGRFMAGMLARRLPGRQHLTGPARFSLSAAILAEDISDDAFGAELSPEERP